MARLEVIEASFLGTLVRDHTTHQVYFRNGGWKRFKDFGIPGEAVSKELSIELDGVVRAYLNNKWLNRGKPQLAFDRSK